MSETPRLRLTPPTRTADAALGERLAELARASTPTTVRLRSHRWAGPVAGVVLLVASGGVAWGTHAVGHRSDEPTVVPGAVLTPTLGPTEAAATQTASSAPAQTGTRLDPGHGSEAHPGQGPLGEPTASGVRDPRGDEAGGGSDDSPSGAHDASESGSRRSGSAEPTDQATADDGNGGTSGSDGSAQPSASASPTNTCTPTTTDSGSGTSCD